MSVKEKNEKKVRVGVFVCHCGSNIGGLINCKELAKYVKKLPNVVYAEDNLYTCSETGLSSIKKAIKEHDLNRVVVAACTPRTHEPLFRECISEAGLNPYLFNFVNIRDQCTWVHMKYPKEAFEKAIDLISMGVAKATKLEPLEMITINVTPAALIIGGGISGMSAAINLSRQGFKTHLVEKENELGGRLNLLYKLFPHDTVASELVEDIRNKVQDAENLQVHKSAKVKSINGFVGNYEVEIEQNDAIINLTVGVIVVAVGASLFTPFKFFEYDGKKRITQYELESKLKNNEINANNVVMIQCVGSRIDERPYCSSVCCMTALKNALIIKDNVPSANVTILFRDIYTPGTNYEKYYRNAREEGVIFIKYDLDKLPSIEENLIKVFNEYLGDYITIPYDLLVLSTPLVANDDNKELAQLLKVPLGANGFFLEAHVKLRPIDFATDGIYIGGTAKWPVDITEAITQGYAAASRASTILSHKLIQVEGAVATVDSEQCIGCGACEMICPYNAIKIERTEKGLKAIVISAVCKGCGVCGASCPLNAISIKHFKDPQIFEQIYAISKGLIEKGG
ncbi:MAG: CoB--CoM heterodisulfide reductase iron-sulfur subunit A family protein [Candidatus Heimdallarchaeota archaeon]